MPLKRALRQPLGRIITLTLALTLTELRLCFLGMRRALHACGRPISQMEMLLPSTYQGENGREKLRRR